MVTSDRKARVCFVLFFTRLDNQMLIHEVLRASLTVDNKEVTGGGGGLAPKLLPMQQQLLQKQQERKPKGSPSFDKRLSNQSDQAARAE